MSTTDIRSHLGTRALAQISQRDLPEELAKTGQADNELWLYQDGRPVRRLDNVEAWHLLNPERRLCPSS